LIGRERAEEPASHPEEKIAGRAEAERKKNKKKNKVRSVPQERAER
jgi:hypothetical protein